MATSIDFSQKNMKSTIQESEPECNRGESKPLKISFDYDQLDYIRFRLGFQDGFLFGFGVIIAFILISVVLSIILSVSGYSLSKMIMSYFIKQMI